MANITGWGRGTWGEGAWGEPVPVTLTGLAATSALGTVSVVAKALRNSIITAGLQQ